jgi:ElaB/YqjD/DUF883 family membrane-anchored ribosome-binding protein
MELYYKDLISKEASLDKLVDNLMLLVQGADEFAEAAGSKATPQTREEIRSRLERLKDGCRQIKEQTVAGARATDKLLRRYPYSSIGFAFAIGLLTSRLISSGRSSNSR